jgi:ABC-type lipoprotein release transport system permease subunit
MKKTYFFHGALQGFLVGCLAGALIGLVTAIQIKRFIVIPLSMISSGIFFGGVSAFGSIIHSADHKLMAEFKEDN